MTEDDFKRLIAEFSAETRGHFDESATVHAEFHRRIRSLEESFADLQARVERLEGTTH